MEHTREQTTTTTTTTMIPSMSRRTRRPRERAKRVNVEAGYKWCPKCEQRLAVEAFGVAKDREDGRTGWCRGCRAARTRDRRAANLDAARKDGRDRYASNPALWHAKVAVARAIDSGRLERPALGTACGRCECVPTGPDGNPVALEAHHHLGHAKEHWLEVVWRCRSCRALADAEQRASADVRASENSTANDRQPRHRVTTIKPVAPRWASNRDDGVAAAV